MQVGTNARANAGTPPRTVARRAAGPAGPVDHRAEVPAGATRRAELRPGTADGVVHPGMRSTSPRPTVDRTGATARAASRRGSVGLPLRRPARRRSPATSRHRGRSVGRAPRRSRNARATTVGPGARARPVSSWRRRRSCSVRGGMLGELRGRRARRSAASDGGRDEASRARTVTGPGGQNEAVEAHAARLPPATSGARQGDDGDEQEEREQEPGAAEHGLDERVTDEGCVHRVGCE